MDLDFKAQEKVEDEDDTLTMFRELSHTYTTQINRFLVWFQPRLLYTRKSLSWRIHRKLRQLVERKFDEMQSENMPKTRSVLMRSLEGLEHLDSNTADEICDQLKTFLFAGHDTTSILLQWAFYELSRTPKALKAIRAELDDIFGSCTAPRIILKMLADRGSELIPKMTYTSAVIKETLRLYPPASTARTAPSGSGFNLTTQDGKQYCADNLLLYMCSFAIQRDPTVFGESADLFVPERWLEDRSARIPLGAWRGFERGPRSCIGQELANIEAKVVLALTVRRYDFIKAGMGELVLDETNQPILDTNGIYKTKSTLFNVSVPSIFVINICLTRDRPQRLPTGQSITALFELN